MGTATQSTLPLPVIFERLRRSPAEVAEFCRRHRVRRMSLFGSVVRDDFEPASDIDVVVEFEPGYRPGFAFFGMAEQLETFFGRRVDLLTADGLGRIGHQVRCEARVIYEAG